MAQAKMKRKPKSHKVDAYEAARRQARARLSAVLTELRETRFCRAPLTSLTGELGECGRKISYGEQHRYLPDGPPRPICMPCVYALQGTRHPMRRSPDQQGPHQGFKPGRVSA